MHQGEQCAPPDGYRWVVVGMRKILYLRILFHYYFLAVVDVEATGGLGNADTLEGVPGIVGGGGGDTLDGGGAVFNEGDAVGTACRGE